MKPLPILEEARPRLPQWFKVRPAIGPRYRGMKALLSELKLHTVCEEARCPNIWECWNRGTATFMILGDICTRSCGFCSVVTGRPQSLDREEPERVARAVAALGLRHAVITSVNRDELPDGGSIIFFETIKKIKEKIPHCRIEVLIPDFKGDFEAQTHVFRARPDILNHNTETVARLYSSVRPQGKYSWSLDLIQRAKAAGLMTKSGLMLGLGESLDEIRQTMSDLTEAGCDILTLGQYLQPTLRHLPVVRYYPPEEFSSLREEGLRVGFRHVEAGPLVRSSYHAEEQLKGVGISES